MLLAMYMNASLRVTSSKITAVHSPSPPSGASAPAFKELAWIRT